jgi:hypothetical protein
LGVLAFFPQAAAAAQHVNLLSNGGVEEPARDENPPPGWYAAAVTAPGLRMFVDDRHSRAGNAALAIANQHQYDQPVCNNWAQDLRSIPAGKMVRLTGYLRIDGAEAANICVQCWTDDGKRMAAFASTSVFRGSCGWTFARAEDLFVPRETTRMTVRAVLTGKGTAYFDDVSLETVGPGDIDISNPYDPQTARLIVRRLPVTKDSMVLAYLPDWDRGDVDNLAVSNLDGGVRTLLSWQMPSLKEADDAGLRFVLAIYCRKSLLRDEPGKLEIRTLFGPWQERISWKNQPGLSPQAAAVFDVSPREGWMVFDVTDLVREQARMPQANFGVALCLPAKTTTRDTWSEIGFASREAEASALRPILLMIKPDAQPPKADRANPPINETLTNESLRKASATDR